MSFILAPVLRLGFNVYSGQDIPFLLEDRIKGLGGKYEKAEKAWGVSMISSFLVVLELMRVFAGQGGCRWTIDYWTKSCICWSHRRCYREGLEREELG